MEGDGAAEEAAVPGFLGSSIMALSFLRSCACVGRRLPDTARLSRRGSCGPTVRFSAVVALGWLLAHGCSAKPTGMPDVAPVIGTITLNGEPLAGASVVFESEGGHSALGTTDSTGRYQLVAPGNQKGAVVGLNKVKITTQLDAPPAPNWKDPIPSRYNSASELSAQVNPGQNSFNFELQRK